LWPGITLACLIVKPFSEAVYGTTYSVGAAAGGDLGSVSPVSVSHCYTGVLKPLKTSFNDWI